MNNLFIAENLKVMTKVLPVLKIQIHQKEISLIVKRDHLIPVLTFLKNHIKYQFKILTCISGVDYPSQKYRFKVVYELLSVKYNTRIRVKVLTDELTPIESCCKIFPAAGWYESETWDMYGIFFANHVKSHKFINLFKFIVLWQIRTPSFLLIWFLLLKTGTL